MNRWHSLLVSFIITSCTINNINPTKLNDIYPMKSLLVASWGEKKAEIIPTYISSGLAFETTPTSKLAPVLFELGDNNKLYIIDASFKHLTIFDHLGSFNQQFNLPSSTSGKTIEGFQIINDEETALLVSDEKSNYELIFWNLKNKNHHISPLGVHRAAHWVPSSNEQYLYIWTEKEDYSGTLWQFSSTDLDALPATFDQLPFSASRVFEKENIVTSIKFFDKYNLRGLISANLKSNAVHEKVCTKDLYGPLLYPIGMDKKHNLFTYGLPTKDERYGKIYIISKEGVLLRTKVLEELTQKFSEDANITLSPYQMWKVLNDGTIVFAAMTSEKLYVFALNTL